MQRLASPDRARAHGVTTGVRCTIFDGIGILHDHRVLEPRSWTESQSRWAAEIAGDLPDGPILELCCGAGQIGLAAARRSARSVVLLDANPTACGFARSNASANHLAAATSVICSRLDDWDPGERAGTYPLVIADPPYLRSREVERFPADPVSAIDGGPDGLDVVRSVLDTATTALHPQGSVVLQLATDEQADAVATLAPHLAEVARRDQGNGVLVHLRWAGERPRLSTRLVAALRSGSTDELEACSTSCPLDEADELRSLAAVHDIWNDAPGQASFDPILQHDPSLAALTARFESQLLTRLSDEAAELRPDLEPGVDGMRHLAAIDRVPRVYRWLERDATWAELVEFLTLEGGPDADFDDLVALAQVGTRGDVKLALAENYWDEMGRGDLERVHTRLHDRLVDAVGMTTLPRDELPAPVLARAVLSGVLATKRHLHPELIGALGLIELQAGPRCRAVVRAMRRLDAPEAAIDFYAEHAEQDPVHGQQWLDRVVAPLSADPQWAQRIVQGAAWRSVVNSRFYTYAEQRFCVR